MRNGTQADEETVRQVWSMVHCTHLVVYWKSAEFLPETGDDGTCDYKDFSPIIARQQN